MKNQDKQQDNDISKIIFPQKIEQLPGTEHNAFACWTIDNTFIVFKSIDDILY